MRDPELVRHIRASLPPDVLCEKLGFLAGRRGRTWQRTSKGFLILCPWLEEHTPSCHVYLAPDGTSGVHCHGCHEDGDALSLVAVRGGLSCSKDFPSVIQAAAELAGIVVATDGAWTPIPLPPPMAPVGPEPLDAATFDVLARDILARCPIDGARDVADYLRGRGLLALARDAGWAALPSERRDRSALREVIVETHGSDSWLRSGLALVKGKYTGEWARWDHRLIIPWRSLDGTIATLQRRLLRSQTDKLEPKYVFPTDRRPEWPYGSDAVATAPANAVMVFVEGATDALAVGALCAKDKIVAVPLGIPGVGNWSNDRAERWAKLGTGKRCVVGFDAEDDGSRAGQNVKAAIARARRDLAAAGARVVDRWRPRGAHDWGDIWAATGGIR